MRDNKEFSREVKKKINLKKGSLANIKTIKIGCEMLSFHNY